MRITHPESSQLGRLSGRPIVGALVALALIATLAGCVGSPTPGSTDSNAGPSRSPSESTVPSVTPTPDPIVAAPPTRVGIGCDDVVSSKAIAAAYSTPLSPSTEPFSDGGRFSLTINSSARLRALGGLQCTWTDGKPMTDSATSGRLLDIRIVPLPAKEWNKYRTTYGLTSDNQQGCSGGPTSGCFLETYVGSYWIDITMRNIRTKVVNDDIVLPVGVAKTIFSAVTSHAKTLGVPTAVWTPPASTIPLPKKCADVVSIAEVGKALGISTPLVYGGVVGGWSLEASIHKATGDPSGCFFQLGNRDANVGSINWLAGGAWAADDYVPSHTTSQLDIAGLGTGDGATTFVRAEHNDLEVNLVVGGNWISFTLSAPGASTTTYGVPRAKAALTIANAIVKHLQRA